MPASGYAARALGLPFAGLFGACSTMAEGLALGAALCEGGAARNLLAMASSHFCAAERQFRTPLSYGAVRTPTAQWTATAAGCCLLQPQGEGVGIAAATFGRVQDYQVKDINNMGAAMAPAAASTLLHYFKDTGTEPQEFDCIYTGDLGQVGSQLLRELLAGPQTSGLQAAMPDGTEILGVSTNGGICTVDLSGAFYDNAFSGDYGLYTAIYSIVDTLTGLDSVDSVIFLKDGASIGSSGIMLLGDAIIEKTSFQMKTPQPVRLSSGRIYLNGRVRGQISGRIDADVHGILHGDISASVDIDNIKRAEEVDKDGQ